MMMLAQRLLFLCKRSHTGVNALHNSVTGHWKGPHRVVKLQCLSLQLRKVSGNSKLGQTFKQVKDPANKTVDVASTATRSKLLTLLNQLLAGGSFIGMGSLIYAGVFWHVPEVTCWPEFVRQRFRDTFMYFGGGMVFTASAALAIARNSNLTHLLGGKGWLPLIASVALAVSSGYVCHSLPYREGLGCKQVVWVVHNIILGMLVAPLSVLGGPVMLHASYFGTGLVWAMAVQAVCCKNDAFFVLGPLTMICSLLFSSSVGSLFLPTLPHKGLQYIMASTSLFGGLVFFGMFLLYETTKILGRSAVHPVDTENPYDPINNSIRIYISAINVMIRIAKILLQEN